MIYLWTMSAASFPEYQGKKKLYVRGKEYAEERREKKNDKANEEKLTFGKCG